MQKVVQNQIAATNHRIYDWSLCEKLFWIQIDIYYGIPASFTS